MATLFQTALINNVGTTVTQAIAAPSNGTITVLGLSLTNLTQSIVQGSVIVGNGASTSAYYAYQITIPPNTSLRLVNGGERLTLASSYTLSLQSNQNNSLDAIVSYVEVL